MSAVSTPPSPSKSPSARCGGMFAAYGTNASDDFARTLTPGEAVAITARAFSASQRNRRRTFISDTGRVGAESAPSIANDLTSIQLSFGHALGRYLSMAIFRTHATSRTKTGARTREKYKRT